MNSGCLDLQKMGCVMLCIFKNIHHLGNLMNIVIHIVSFYSYYTFKVVFVFDLITYYLSILLLNPKNEARPRMPVPRVAVCTIEAIPLFEQLSKTGQVLHAAYSCSDQPRPGARQHQNPSWWGETSHGSSILQFC